MKLTISSLALLSLLTFIAVLPGCGGDDSKQQSTSAENSPVEPVDSGSDQEPAPSIAYEPTPDASTAAADNATPPPPQPTSELAADAKPETVLDNFLTALLKGDPIAGALVTDLAWSETHKHGMKIEPIGTPDSKYKIGAVTLVRGDAHISSLWAENGESFEVKWVLRREKTGWRVAGFATKFVPTQPPTFLNFEDPLDMMQKYQAVVAAMDAYQQQQAAQQVPRATAAAGAPGAGAPGAGAAGAGAAGAAPNSQANPIRQAQLPPAGNGQPVQRK